MDKDRVETTLYSLSNAVPSTMERREDDRFLTLFRVGALVIEEQRQLCLIRNISAGGMLIRAFTDLIAGTRLSIELKQGQNVDGFVSWVDGNSAGIEFDSRVDIVDLLSVAANGPRPRMPRIEVRCLASVRVGAQVHRMLAMDISQGGMKTESDRSLEIGSDVVITLPGLSPVPGVVRWRDAGSYGIAFNRLLALAELVAWLQDQRDGAAATGTGGA